jgi:hypothetical protein
MLTEAVLIFAFDFVLLHKFERCYIEAEPWL